MLPGRYLDTSAPAFIPLCPTCSNRTATTHRNGAALIALIESTHDMQYSHTHTPERPTRHGMLNETTAPCIHTFTTTPPHTHPHTCSPPILQGTTFCTQKYSVAQQHSLPPQPRSPHTSSNHRQHLSSSRGDAPQQTQCMRHCCHTEIILRDRSCSSS